MTHCPENADESTSYLAMESAVVLSEPLGSTISEI